MLAAARLAAFSTAAAPASAGTAPAMGELAPTLLGKDGRKDVDLSAYRGKIVIVTFWASWCGYCRKELPALNALQEQAGDQWLKVVAVNVEDSTEDYRAMTRQMHDYKLLLTRDRDGSIAATYDVRSYPNLWIIDPQGRVASHHVGYGEDSLQEIIDQIKALLTKEMERQRAAQAATPAA
jgi:thiol-disulfide isomerase/thioredoxin